MIGEQQQVKKYRRHKKAGEIWILYPLLFGAHFFPCSLSLVVVSTQLAKQARRRLDRGIIRRGGRRLVLAVAASARREAVPHGLGRRGAGRRLHDGRLRVVLLLLLRQHSRAGGGGDGDGGGGVGGRGERDGARGRCELAWDDAVAERLLVLLGAVQEGQVAALDGEVGVDVVLGEAGVGGQVGVWVRERRVACCVFLSVAGPPSRIVECGNSVVMEGEEFVAYLCQTAQGSQCLAVDEARASSWMETWLNMLCRCRRFE